jgi:hypothetical protein
MLANAHDGNDSSNVQFAREQPGWLRSRNPAHRCIAGLSRRKREMLQSCRDTGEQPAIHIATQLTPFSVPEQRGC